MRHMNLSSFDQLSPETTAGSVAILAATNVAALSVNKARDGLLITADPGNTTPLLVLLGPGVASATNYHLVIAAGTSREIALSGEAWLGAVALFSTAAGRYSVVEW